MSSPTGPGGIAISSDATRDWADSELF
jgi:hypothetical protein